MDIYATFLRAVRRHSLVADGDRVLVAVSGGSDSVALLHLLLALREHEGGIELAVIHLDHGIRGEAGAADAAFVHELAARHGLECRSERLAQGAESEDALRRQRHGFYLRQAVAWAADAVALGSTRDDQAETVLLNLMRGAGSKGLGGMEPARPLAPEVEGDDEQAIGLIRPLLDLPRAELRKWLQDKGLDWREDATNSDPRYLRNRVRAEMMPLVESLRPGAGKVLARAAGLLRDDEALLEALARAEMELSHLGEGRYDAQRLAELPTALARRLVRMAAMAGTSDPPATFPLSGPASGAAVETGAPLPLRPPAGATRPSGETPWAPGARQVEMVLDLARERRGGRVDLGNGCIACVKGGELWFDRPKPHPKKRASC